MNASPDGLELGTLCSAWVTIGSTSGSELADHGLHGRRRRRTVFLVGRDRVVHLRLHVRRGRCTGREEHPSRRSSCCPAPCCRHWWSCRRRSRTRQRRHRPSRGWAALVHDDITVNPRVEIKPRYCVGEPRRAIFAWVPTLNGRGRGRAARAGSRSARRSRRPEARPGVAAGACSTMELRRARPRASPTPLPRRASRR